MKKSPLNIIGIKFQSPLNDLTQQENEAKIRIAERNKKYGVNPNRPFALAAWNRLGKGYTDRKVKFEGRPNERPLTHEENIKERNRESHEFYYDVSGKFTEHGIKPIPTDDSDQPVKGFKEKLQSWQLSPFKNK
ncbi:MAG TPA: hypothetical protein EYQ51_01625 [Alphaproteobacteria bacterium]|nr:hypothetical protein [Alphaproteobacteria bacterium]